MEVLEKIEKTTQELSKWLEAEKIAKSKCTKLKEELKSLMEVSKQKKIKSNGISAYFSDNANYVLRPGLTPTEVETGIANGVLEIKIAKGQSDMAVAQGYVQKQVIPGIKFTTKLLKK